MYDMVLVVHGQKTHGLVVRHQTNIAIYRVLSGVQCANKAHTKLNVIVGSCCIHCICVYWGIIKMH